MNLSFIYKNSIILNLLKIITLKFTMFILTILTYSLSRSLEIIFFTTHNPFHNILRLFDVLPNFPFTTSETMGDYYL